MLTNILFNNEEFILYISVTQLFIKHNIHIRHDHVCLSTPARLHARTPARLHARTLARLKHSTLKSKFVHARFLSCARPHARTMQSYKARLLYMISNTNILFDQ